MQQRRDDPLIVGRIVGLLGVRGWLKIESYTDPRDNIQNYSPWLLQSGAQPLQLTVEAVQPHGKGLTAKLAGIDDRDAAAVLLGSQIAISADQLPALAAGEVYWRDLIGLTVINQHGERLGEVESLLETGANDVLVVRHAEQEILIPYIPQQVILSMDLEQAEIRVDWEKDY